MCCTSAVPDNAKNTYFHCQIVLSGRSMGIRSPRLNTHW